MGKNSIQQDIWGPKWEKQRLLEKEARKKQKEHIEQYRDEIESEINKEDPNSDLL